MRIWISPRVRSARGCMLRGCAGSRSSAGPSGPGNSVPRFHVTWGSGPGVMAPFERRVREHVQAGRVQLHFRHRVGGLVVTNGVVHGVHGDLLEPTSTARGVASARTVLGEFVLHAGAVIVTSGGI